MVKAVHRDGPRDPVNLVENISALTLVRNPYFKQWSSVAQPQGFVDQIRVVVMSLEQAEAAVTAGSVDVVDLGDLGLGPADLSGLKQRYPGQVFTDQAQGTAYLKLDTRDGPFANPYARAALAAALNRPLAAAAQDNGTPACGLVPPDFPAADDSQRCSQDLALANKLVDRSGTRDQKVRIPDLGPGGVFGVVASTLRALGYRPVPVHTFARAADMLNRQPPAIDIAEEGWYPDFGAPSQLYVPVSCPGGYLDCSHKAEAMAQAAGRLAASGDSAAALAQWRATYRLVEQLNIVLPFLYYQRSFLVSERAAPSYTSMAEYGPILSRMWVR